MPQFIKEKETVWEMLKNCGKPIVMYGMGDGALKIMKRFEQFGIKLSEIFASDEFVRGHSFCGYKVKKLSEIEEQYDDFVIVMAFAIFDDPMTARIKEIASKHTFVAPDVPVAGENLFDFDFLRENKDKILEVYNMLADEKSRQVYADIINFKLSGKIEYLFNCTTTKDEAYENILKLGDKEIFADLGAYKGETIEEFLHYTNGNYKGVIAFEPDAKNYKKLCINMDSKGIMGEFYNVAANCKEETLLFANKAGRNSSLSKKEGKPIHANSLDNLAEEVSFINMDVEGAEKQALEGARRIITSYKPKMLISIYHRSEDVFAIPLQIKSLNPDYKFYMRHYQYIPAWDTNLYCV